MAAAISVLALPVMCGAMAPDVSLTLLGLNGGALEQGEPVRVSVRLAVSRGESAPVELAPASGSWVDALTVELAPAVGGAAVARAQPLGASTSASATLDRARVAGGTWIFSAATMQRIAAGEYRVQARLAIAAGRGWNGSVASVPAPLRIVATSGDPVRVAARALGRAQLAAAEGKLEDAARLADAVLAQNPDHFELLCVRAEVALRAGNPLAARLCVSRATRLLPAKSSGPAPLLFEDVSRRVVAAKLTSNPPPAKPPEWTWPPPAVMRFPEIEKILASRATAAATPAIAASAAPPSAAAGFAPAIASPPAKSVSPAPPSPAAPSTPLLGRIVPTAELNDAKIRADPAGQWAASAAAGSFQGNAYGYYTPSRAVGAPKVVYAGYNTEAWCPGRESTGEEWIELTFAQETKAAAVRVRQTFNPGAIAKVEATAADGTKHLWWQGVDPHTPASGREFAWFAVAVPPTSYPVAKIRLTLDLARCPGWKQIDAVQLVAAP